MKQIITVQHTQSVHHLNGMVGSWTDWELTEYGHKQADRIAANLFAQFGDRSVKIYSSDLKRAVQTAAPIALVFAATPVYDKRLREVNLGPAVGKSGEWLRQNQQPSGERLNFRYFPDAESHMDVYRRIKPLFEEIVSGSDETVFVVSHGAALCSFHALCLNLDFHTFDYDEVKNKLHGKAGGVSVFTQMPNGHYDCVKISDMSYQE